LFNSLQLFWAFPLLGTLAFFLSEAIMTTETDKLVEMAQLFHDTYEALAPAFGYETRPDTKAFDPESPNGKLMCATVAKVRTAIIASLCGDVEPVAWLHKQGAHTELSERELLEDEKERGWTQKPLYPASTVAALKARVAELEKDAARYRWLRDGELTADYPYPVMRMGGSRVDDQTIWADELDAAIDDAISAAQHPQQEQSN